MIPDKILKMPRLESVPAFIGVGDILPVVEDLRQGVENQVKVGERVKHGPTLTEVLEIESKLMKGSNPRKLMFDLVPDYRTFSKKARMRGGRFILDPKMEDVEPKIFAFYSEDFFPCNSPKCESLQKGRKFMMVL